LADAISKLVNHVETHQDKVEQPFEIFFKKKLDLCICFNIILIIQYILVSINSALDKYRCDGEVFPHTVEYNDQNLLSIYDASDHERFARKIMKVLFTPAKMSESILSVNPVYTTKSGLDPNRMKIFKD
ncbi:unnamed protein product, partial [Rotaria magnacalcarata]